MPLGADPLHSRLEQARTLFFARKYPLAEQAFRALLQVAPDHPEALHFLGVLAYLRHDYLTGRHLVERALPRRRNDPEIHANLGLILQASGDLKQAIKHFRRAVALAPMRGVYHANLATALRDTGALGEASIECDRAIRLEPDQPLARLTRALCGLLGGDTRSVWLDHESRIPAEHGRPLATHPGDPGSSLPPASTWIHEDLSEQRILVCKEQGIGDELFFLRYAPILKRRCQWLGYLASPKLAPLLARIPDLDSVYIAPNEIHATRTMLVGDLPLVAESAADHPPAPLRLYPWPEHDQDAAELLQSLGKPPYLAITWRAGADGRLGELPRRRKEVPVDQLASAIARWSGTIISLQRQARPGEIEALGATVGRPVHDLGRLNEDLPMMLGALHHIDEYVGVSNANMHLRASLALPARVLVSVPPDWRWTESLDRSPWFPDFTVYRESRASGWQSALSRLGDDLDDAMRTRAQRIAGSS